MIISTIKEKCKQCYACVRNCPVKAVKIEKGQAEVIESRCIECGNCIKVCSQDAKQVLDSRADVKRLLSQKAPTALVLAPSFAASFNQVKPLQAVASFKKMGFKEVWTAAMGAQLLIPEYEKFIGRNSMTISSPCPAICSLIEKHFPELLKNLAPIVSPMVATARYIKSLNPRMQIVFAGPCTAKKGEIQNFPDLINYCLTFKELKQIMAEERIEPHDLEEEDFTGPVPFNGQLIPLTGGLSKMMNMNDSMLETDFLTVDGQKECYQTLEALDKGQLTCKFVDMLMCKGCIDGPSIDTEDDFYLRHRSVAQYFTNIPLDKRMKGKADIAEITNVDLSRAYVKKRIERPYPQEDEIKAILASTGKLTEGDEINCGACGYNSCREKAIAVFQGLAEVDMCLPYLLEKKTNLLEVVDQENVKIKELNQELDTIVEGSYDGICITDGNGIISRANKAFMMLYGLSDSWIGTYAGEIEERGLVSPSVTVLVLKEKRTITLIQEIRNGRTLLATGTPVVNEEGKLTNIVINSRDFSELEKIRHKFEQNLEEKTKAKKNLGTDNIIAYSQKMADVLDTCRKIAKVDSTVLVTGESGVGKEVVAGYIHSISARKEGPWVKVNCGSIPENLIESELFGYEFGAFTGAKREGKIGMFELADKGTIFLDEIGELPYNLQVKLLQVLQEKYIIRIGGIKPVQINTRIIAATNRDLEDMVERGKFRRDLFYRLNVVPILVPSLRDRKDDIIPLATHFLEQFNAKYGAGKKIGREVLEAFLGYNWPGNIRELVNLIERLVVTSDKKYIELADIPGFLRDQPVSRSLDGLPNLQEAVDQLEKEILQKAYKLYNNSYKMAEALGVNQSTVIRKLKKHKIT